MKWDDYAQKWSIERQEMWNDLSKSRNQTFSSKWA